VWCLQLLDIATNLPRSLATRTIHPALSLAFCWRHSTQALRLGVVVIVKKLTPPPSAQTKYMTPSSTKNDVVGQRKVTEEAAIFDRVYDIIRSWTGRFRMAGIASEEGPTRERFVCSGVFEGLFAPFTFSNSTSFVVGSLLSALAFDPLAGEVCGYGWHAFPR